MLILLTGATGYIGSHTVIELLKNEYDVIGIDNFSNSTPEVLNRINELSGVDFSFFEGDIADKEFLEGVFEKKSVDAVIHFAGYKAVGESVHQPLSYYRNNVSGFLALCEVMQKHSVKKFVFSSSATVYGDRNSVPFTENMSLNATNPYGRTKIMIEEILQDLYKSDNEWSISILRYFNPIGAHESGMIGENPNGIPNNLMPYITQVAAGRREYLSVFGNCYDTYDGTGVRDYIHVVDLAKGHLKALEHINEYTGAEVFNLGTGKGYSVLEIIKAFEDATGVSIPYKIVEPRQGDISECYADCTKANQVLGWKAEKAIEDMCRDSWKWQEKNPKGY